MREVRPDPGGVSAVAAMQVTVVLNPRTAGDSRAALWHRALDVLRARAEVTLIETRGDGADVERIAACVRETRVDVLVAAGGDGTVNNAVCGLLRAPPAERPALALVALGTGNNVARALGLPALQSRTERGVELALEAILSGRRRAIDVGVVNGHPFMGSFAIGMDADILVLRNRLRRRLGLTGETGGYALYLLSFAANLFTRHGGGARVVVDGSEEKRRVYGMALLNTPLYAGEFRFDAGNDADDGLLDLHAIASARQYLSEYPRAWRRHLRFQRGEGVVASPQLRHGRDFTIEMERPLAAHIDGEELGAASQFRVRVLPGAIEVCVPGPERSR